MTNPAAVEDLRSMEKLPAKTVAGYGAGDFAFNLAFSLSTAFLLYYYTDVAGISAAAVGTMFLVVRLWDAFADLLAGRLVDRTMTRWGKFRPFIMFGAVPLLFMSFLVFHVPTSFDQGMKIIYAYATYAILGLVYSLVNIPYGSLGSAITQSVHERAKLVSARAFGAGIGGVGLFFAPANMFWLVPLPGGHHRAAARRRGPHRHADLHPVPVDRRPVQSRSATRPRPASWPLLTEHHERAGDSITPAHRA
jgi:Na+/melibiose symporter-like transporter